jgi:K+-transporting ATPase A subunit
MILTIIAVLILLWLLGIVVHIGGGLIHLLLVVALVVFIWDRTVGRRRPD